MVIDSHLHVLKAENFDEVTEAQIGHRHPEDTPIEDLVGWLVDAGVHKAVVMGQDTTRMWNSSCGEDYVLECVNQYPDLFVPLAAVEAVDRSGRLNRAGLEYVDAVAAIVVDRRSPEMGPQRRGDQFHAMGLQ